MNNDNRLNFRRRFGKRLRTLRLNKGISKADVAAALGCTVQNVDGIERGDWSTDMSNLSALADALLRVDYRTSHFLPGLNHL